MVVSISLHSKKLQNPVPYALADIKLTSFDQLRSSIDGAAGSLSLRIHGSNASGLPKTCAVFLNRMFCHFLLLALKAVVTSTPGIPGSLEDATFD